MKANQTATVTISVNIAAADLYEGNAEWQFEVDPVLLRHFAEDKLGEELKSKLMNAVLDFETRNS